MTRKLTIFVMLMISAITIFSQEKKTSDISAAGRKAETDRLVKLSQKLEGTYQLQIIDSRELPALPLGLMDSIEVKRQQNQTVYLWLKNNTRMVIPSYAEINGSGFQPLQRVKYISASDIKNSK